MSPDDDTVSVKHGSFVRKFVGPPVVESPDADRGSVFSHLDRNPHPGEPLVGLAHGRSSRAMGGVVDLEAPVAARRLVSALVWASSAVP